MKIKIFISIFVLMVSFGIFNVAKADWTAEYWNLASPMAQPTMPIRAADYSTTVSGTNDINLDWGFSSPDASINSDGFVARFTQVIDFSAGEYIFSTVSDDGARVYVDGNLVSRNGWIDQGGYDTYYGTTTLSAGSHNVVVEYYENAEAARVHFWYGSFPYTGQGTSENPYGISDCLGLQALSNYSTGNLYFELSGNIDCSATSISDTEDPNYNANLYNSGSGFTPITSFAGKLDGNNYTISNVYINHPLDEKIGLFNYLGYDSIVSRMNISNIEVTGGTGYAGALAGHIQGYVIGVNITGGIVTSSSTYTGGFVGYINKNDAVIKSSYTGTVTGNGDYTGGFVGTIVNGSISDIYANVTVNGVANVGGIAGLESYCCTSISRAYARGTVTGSGTNVGGLVGYTQGGSDVVITDSFSAVHVSGAGSVGAIGGNIQDGVTVDNNHYDSTIEDVAPPFGYGSSTGQDAECTPHNISSDFYSNLNAPLSGWNFSTIWMQNESSYPILRPVPSLSIPGVPTNLSATTESLTFNVAWDAPLNTGGFIISSYGVEVKKSSNDWSHTIINTSTSNTSYSFSGYISFGETYDARVYAVNPYGQSAYSDVVRITVPDAPIHYISNCTQLQAIDDDLYVYADTFKVTQNFSCEGVDFKPLGWDGWEGFQGIFDGQGFTISDLTINYPQDTSVGFFSNTYYATIKNLTLNNGSVSGINSVGVFTGEAHESTFENLHTNLSVFGIYNTDWGWGGQNIGGLVGYIEDEGFYSNGSTIKDSSMSGGVFGAYAVGGLVGYLEQYPSPSNSYGSDTITSFTNNIFTGTIDASNTDIGAYGTGGLIGYAYVDQDDDDGTNTEIIISGNTINSSLISSRGDAGGLIATVYNYLDYVNQNSIFTITNNIISANIESTGNNVGGIMGTLENDAYDDSERTTFNINNNIISGDISSSGMYVGGLIGTTVLYNENTGSSMDFNVSGNNSSANISGDSYVGGLIGYIYNYNYETSGYNFLLSGNFSTGSVVGTSGEIGGLVGYIYNSDNIDSKIENSYATGNVTGASYDVGGLVGYNYKNNILNSHYGVGTVTNTGERTGGLVGFNDNGNITNSYSSGIVNGAKYTGGLTGSNKHGDINTSYSVSSVSGANLVGGIAGYTINGTIANTYNRGAVTGGTGVGGLIGNVASGDISNSYSTGVVTASAVYGGLIGRNNSGTINNSFWDVDTSLQPSSWSGTGKTTLDIVDGQKGMKNILTFTDTENSIGLTDPWNFSDIWSIDVSGVRNDGYPYLQMQALPINDGPTEDKFQSDIEDGFIYVTGNPTTATKVTFTTDYTIKTGTATAVLPAGTEMTKTGGGTLDFTTMSFENITNALKNATTSNIAGAVSLGITGLNLSFSVPITITIPVDSSYNTQTLSVYFQNAGSSVWNDGLSCVVADGFCVFQTNHATKYSAGDNPTIVTTTHPVSTGGGGGILLSLTQTGKSEANDLSSGRVVSEIQKVTKDLIFGKNSKDVKTLQLFLIAENKGKASQALSKNKTTNYFGKLTKEALKEWQKAMKISPATGNFGPKTRYKIKELGL